MELIQWKTSPSTTLTHWVFFVKKKEKKIIVLFVFQALTQKVVKMYENDVRSWLSKRKKPKKEEMLFSNPFEMNLKIYVIYVSKD